jgi:hypothetical protein
MKHTITKLLVAAAMFTGITSASAVVPHYPDLVSKGNLWRFTNYNDASFDHNTIFSEPICFEYDSVIGSHLRYRWYVQNFPQINGIASQEGDQITMTGEYPFFNTGKYAYQKSYQFELATQEAKSMGTGHSQILFRSGDRQFGLFMNLLARRAGKCEGFNPELTPDKLDRVDEESDNGLYQDIIRSIRKIEKRPDIQPARSVAGDDDVNTDS